ncbi:hypothetical protein [Dyadobacter psychrotolerans]|jgi:hypothetical protein|uniref:XRE family transcriptional regulator n=1 Tax=Dyadobacter psychrotolerans TaxID=2541721 RepID=A0A4R5D5E4_9BACT|nr:hypothetical protein [Dyadobacter psychrotolerans]TDE08672.1 hypothetical protein E0F88_32090 [Dyadobacter psychrotolerans]
MKEIIPGETFTQHIERRAIKHKAIFQELNVTRDGWFKRRTKLSRLTVGELISLASILSLTSYEVLQLVENEIENYMATHPSNL